MRNKSKPIPSALLALVREEDQLRFKQDYYEANFALEIIKGAIEKKLEALATKEESELLFNEPGYIEHFISLIGQRKMARELLQLFPSK